MTRSEWIDLANEFFAEAHALIGLSRWGLAYYVAGYAVECALKACVLKRLAADPGLILEDGGFQGRARTHDLDELIKAAGLKGAYDAQYLANDVFAGKWEVVRGWNERSRYTRQGKAAAENLIAAISGDEGVLTWIMTHTT